MKRGIFSLRAPYRPTGDQPAAIASLQKGLAAGLDWQVLLGVTGSGKTFTIANVIAAQGRPTLVLAHNKTLAAQLWSELKEYFPDNAVHYFVSYYDYYQPEAYIAATDTYIEKDLEINEEIDRLRHAATHAILTREDVIIVATVSCIYGLGSPQQYRAALQDFKRGDEWSRAALARRLTEMHYERADLDFRRGRFRFSGDTVDIFPAYEESFWRLQFEYDRLVKLTAHHPVSQQRLRETESLQLFPAKHFVTEQNTADILAVIKADLKKEVAAFEQAGQLVEGRRLQQRVKYDLEMIKEIGTVKGIENYSRYFDRRLIGSPPSVLLDFFPKDFLMIIDESHMTIPQLNAMYAGDRSRKESLVSNGFRLRAAFDNRPLTFDEFVKRLNQVVAVSATPSEYELERAKNVVEQIIRPTGLLDPEVVIRPTDGQIDDLIEELKARKERGERALVTTLTKRMAEDLTEYLQEAGLLVQYLHSDIDTVERSEILADLRRGKFDVVVGINLLREGLDLPEVSLVAILDADKEGFLRSENALIQNIGRAARHERGLVIMYADRQTKAIMAATRETTRRRLIQDEYNKKHNIKPKGIHKEIRETGLKQSALDEAAATATAKRLPRQKRALLIEELRDQMAVAAANLDFENAARLRDRIKSLNKL